MSRIIYLIAGTVAQGVKDAEARGCTRIAAQRLADPEKNDIRVVTRFNDMVPMAGKTEMIRGSDFDTMPDVPQLMALEIWQANHDDFEKYVADGHGEWVELKEVLGT
jgi:hypothetical protein